jgi:hypothetical protein
MMQLHFTFLGRRFFFHFQRRSLPLIMDTHSGSPR